MAIRINIEKILPQNAYFASYYLDEKIPFCTRRVYYENGDVMAYDGIEWWQVCRFSPHSIVQLKEFIVSLNLKNAGSLVNKNEVQDAALLTYAWNIKDDVGMLQNECYPAKEHPLMVALDNFLYEKEELNKT